MFTARYRARLPALRHPRSYLQTRSGLRHSSKVSGNCLLRSAAINNRVRCLWNQTIHRNGADHPGTRGLQQQVHLDGSYERRPCTASRQSTSSPGGNHTPCGSRTARTNSNQPTNNNNHGAEGGRPNFRKFGDYLRVRQQDPCYTTASSINVRPHHSALTRLSRETTSDTYTSTVLL